METILNFVTNNIIFISFFFLLYFFSFFNFYLNFILGLKEIIKATKHIFIFLITLFILIYMSPLIDKILSFKVVKELFKNFSTTDKFKIISIFISMIIGIFTSFYKKIIYKLQCVFVTKGEKNFRIYKNTNKLDVKGHLDFESKKVTFVWTSSFLKIISNKFFIECFSDDDRIEFTIENETINDGLQQLSRNQYKIPLNKLLFKEKRFDITFLYNGFDSEQNIDIKCQITKECSLIEKIFFINLIQIIIFAMIYDIKTENTNINIV